MLLPVMTAAFRKAPVLCATTDNRRLVSKNTQVSSGLMQFAITGRKHFRFDCERSAEVCVKYLQIEVQQVSGESAKIPEYTIPYHTLLYSVPHYAPEKLQYAAPSMPHCTAEDKTAVYQTK